MIKFRVQKDESIPPVENRGLAKLLKDLFINIANDTKELDEHKLEAVQYQNATPANFTYKKIRVELGTADADATVTFQQAFTGGLLFTIPLDASSKSKTGFTMPSTASDWMAIGYDT